MVSNTTHGDNCQRLQSHRYGVHIKAGNQFGVSSNNTIKHPDLPEACSIYPNPANFDFASLCISECFCKGSNRSRRCVDMRYCRFGRTRASSFRSNKSIIPRKLLQADGQKQRQRHYHKYFTQRQNDFRLQFINQI